MRARKRMLLLASAVATITVVSAGLRADTGNCGGASITLPFTDVPSSNIFFCSIGEAFFSGLTNGTTGTTYSPSAAVPREQMAAFVTRTMDQSVKRSSKRAALNQYWTTQGTDDLDSTVVGTSPQLLQSDGADVWVANFNGNSVSRVRASDGSKVGNDWTGANSATGILCAKGKVFVTGSTSPGSLYEIDPTQAPGPVTTLSTALGGSPKGIAYDGHRIWTANAALGGGVSIITLNPTNVITITSGFNNLYGIVYDGSNMWVTDDTPNAVDKLHKLDSNGNILLSLDMGSAPGYPAFDGTNIWVPNFNSGTVIVVRATGIFAGTVLTTLSGNGLSGPASAAFDGERILVTNLFAGVSLWKASDLTPIGTFPTGANTRPFGACSDGLNFWITLSMTGKLARF